MTRKVLTLNQARQAALQGMVEAAVPALRHYADQGDASASASLAELLAFQGEWDECLERAGVFISKLRSVYAGNVFNDMIYLLGRAGRETHQWERLLRLAEAAMDHIEENIADDPPPKQEAERKRYSRIFQALADYAQREGAPPLELIRIFGGTQSTQEEQEADYQKATQQVFQKRPKLRNDPDALLSHYFVLAKFFHQEAEGIRLYEEGRMPAYFDNAVFVARAYVHQEQPEPAWDVLWKHMRRWWPLDRAQVAPVILLIDTDLAGLMNRERCQNVLILPRGPAASTEG